jgi:hypothetical protein
LDGADAHLPSQVPHLLEEMFGVIVDRARPIPSKRRSIDKYGALLAQ